MATAAAVKIVPGVLLVVAPWLEPRRAARWLGGFAVGAVLCLLVVPALSGGLDWTFREHGAFASVLLGASPAGRPRLPWGDNCANHSLLFAFHHLFGKCSATTSHSSLVLPVYRVLLAGIAAGLAGVALWGSWLFVEALRRRDGRDRSGRSPEQGRDGPTESGRARSRIRLLVWAQAGLAALLVTPISWPHQWVLAVLPVGALWACSVGPEGWPWRADQDRHLRWAAAGLALALWFLLASAHELERRVRVGTVALCWYGVWVALTVLVSWAAVRYGRRWRGAGASVS